MRYPSSGRFRVVPRLEALVDRITPASAGALDETFGLHGKVTTTFNDQSQYLFATAIQPDGKIVAVGVGDLPPDTFGGHHSIALARYNVDGSLDQTFGLGGKVLSDPYPGTNASYDPNGLAFDANGKILVLGLDSNAWGIALYRYNSDGSLDTSFGNNGGLNTGVVYQNTMANAITVDADGKILVAGGYTVFTVGRFNVDGSPDSSFGISGYRSVKFGPPQGSSDELHAIAVDSSGRVILAGTTRDAGSTSKFAVARLLSNGNLDTSFDVDGMQTVEFGPTLFADGVSVAVDSADRIVVAGDTKGPRNWGPYYDMAAARLNVDGSLDTTFADGGRLRFHFSNASAAEVVLIDTTDKVVLAGWSGSSFAVARFNVDGSLDRSFSGDGRATARFRAGQYAFSAAMDQDGKIVLGGYTFGGRDFALARFLGAGTTAESTGGDLIVTGTDNRDSIVIRPSKTVEHIDVLADGRVIGTFPVSGITGRIVVHGLSGNDKIWISRKVTLPTVLFGDAGNDVITGGGGNDQLIGGTGNDRLIDPIGTNILLGGEGADRLTAGTGDDLLIAAPTDFDTDVAALDSFFAEWTSGSDYQDRVSHLIGPIGGANGTTFLSATTVHDDAVKDYLTGAKGTDYFVVAVLDKLDLKLGEQKLTV